ncbi:MAG TPA: MarR family transcriptional regulator [Methylibium sp.]|nr:MarR family transcriptional regulator [Methylibium sp.]
MARSTPAMASALPDLPMQQAVIVRLVRILAASMTDYFDPVFRKTGLTENSFHVLCLLVAADVGQASPSELSELVGTSRANMTRILEQLVQDGLVSRTVVALDARRHVIEITPRGRKAAAATVPRISAPLMQAFSALSPARIAALGGALQSVIVALDEDR